MKRYATDAIKDIMLELRKSQGADLQDTDVITRYEVATGSFSIVGSYWEIQTRNIGSSFILGHPINGLLGSYSTHTLGDWRQSTVVQISGGHYF